MFPDKCNEAHPWQIQEFFYIKRKDRVAIQREPFMVFGLYINFKSSYIDV